MPGHEGRLDIPRGVRLVSLCGVLLGNLLAKSPALRAHRDDTFVLALGAPGSVIVADILVAIVVDPETVDAFRLLGGLIWATSASFVIMTFSAKSTGRLILAVRFGMMRSRLPTVVTVLWQHLQINVPDRGAHVLLANPRG